jgi:hypothetical protein
MAGPFVQELLTLRNLVMQARELLDPETIPEGRAERAHELLGAAVALADDLLTTSPAAALGSKGGKKLASTRGPEYFRELAAKRKVNGGGRPRKQEG